MFLCHIQTTKNRIYYGDVGYFDKLNTTTQTHNEHFEINEKGTKWITEQTLPNWRKQTND